MHMPDLCETSHHTPVAHTIPRYRLAAGSSSRPRADDGASYIWPQQMTTYFILRTMFHTLDCASPFPERLS